MTWAKKSIVIALLAITLILVVSCSGQSSTQTPPLTPTPSSTLTSPVPTSPLAQTSTPAPSVSPSPSNSPSPSTVTPTTTTSSSPNPPSSSPTPNPGQDKRFFINTIISGYNEIPKADGSIEKIPIYQDVYLDLNILGYYTAKDAIFVPRIPTVTDHDDWFIRIKIPSFLMKPWLMNWGYTVDKTNPSASIATLSTTVYTQEVFNANYYTHPDLLLGYDLKGDRGLSSSGIYCKSFQNPGDYVILLRTNEPDAISGFWIKLGTEGSISSPTP